MAENRRENAFRIGAGKRVVIGMADPGGLHFDQDFTGARAFQIHFLDRQRGAGFPCDCCFGLHGEYSCKSVNGWRVALKYRAARRCRGSLAAGSPAAANSCAEL